VERWVKKTIILLLIFLILLSSFSFTAQSGIKIWPGKLYIEMNKWFDEEKEIRHPIHITNPYSHGVNVTTRIENPSSKSITERFTPLPNISWVRTDPERVYLPPKTSKDVEVVINIPLDQQLYYNEKWETGAVIKSDIPLGSGDSMNFELEISVKLYIITPKGEVEESQYFYILLFFIFSIIIFYIAILFIRKKKENLKSFYYFKNKK
jgi:hypothetical protein